MPSWKIDFFATAPPGDPTSGLSRAVWELSASLSARGHRVRVLYPDDHRPQAREHRGVAVVPVPLTGTRRRPFGRDIAFGRNASRALDRSADLLIANDEKAGALELPTGARAPVFGYFVHDIALHTFDTLRPLEERRGLRQTLGNWVDRRTLVRLEGKGIRAAAAVVVASAYNRELLQRYYPMPAERVHLVPHGVPDPLDVGTREECRTSLNVPVDVPTVAFIGRTPDRQGLPVALEAFKRVRVFFPGARFLVVGSPVRSGTGVMGLGVVDEETKAKVLRAADVFIFPAKYEGFGLAPREAMRYGLATIVSRHVPMEGLPDQEACRVVASDDPGEFASDLAELLADPALRREIGTRGREYADRFSYARMAERFEEVFGPLLERRPAG
ncbi:MAG: glycosyltransferase family 4 protein [Thermoplasmata archaeon]|nr:glycosyltransferase family 4 protein [Thermoplasmata archaeon]